MPAADPTRAKERPVNRMNRAVAIAIATCSLGSIAHAADSADTQQRNVNQQQRIQQGLQSGALSVSETARLEREQAHVERLETRALRDGAYSAQAGPPFRSKPACVPVHAGPVCEAAMTLSLLWT
jgi:hypothetical protein